MSSIHERPTPRLRTYFVVASAFLFRPQIGWGTHAKEEGNELDIAIDRREKKKDLEADGNESVHTCVGGLRDSSLGNGEQQ